MVKMVKTEIGYKISIADLLAAAIAKACPKCGQPMEWKSFDFKLSDGRTCTSKHVGCTACSYDEK